MQTRPGTDNQLPGVPGSFPNRTNALSDKTALKPGILPVKVSTENFVDTILISLEEASKTNNYQQVETHIQHVLVYLKSNPQDIEKIYYLSVLYVAKKHPYLFLKGALYEVTNGVLE